MAERHWRFRPKMVRDLEAKGALMEALFEAQETTLAEMEALTAARSGAENDAAAGARSGLGNDSREIYSAPATVCVLWRTKSDRLLANRYGSRKRVRFLTSRLLPAITGAIISTAVWLSKVSLGVVQAASDDPCIQCDHRGSAKHNYVFHNLAGYSAAAHC